ncbi:MAG: hypothetical protein IH962_05640 [Chloroflexi bacterium]|nr:hypothetical protein [Chloroflexota bacterium]
MAQLTSVPSSDDVDQPAPCSHHWEIQPATGPESQGICQLCGEVRAFKNYVEGATWGNSRRAAQSNTDSSQSVVQPLPVKEKDDDEDAEDE